MIDHTQVRTVRASDTARVQPMERTSRAAGPIAFFVALAALAVSLWWFL